MWILLSGSLAERKLRGRKIEECWFVERMVVVAQRIQRDKKKAGSLVKGEIGAERSKAINISVGGGSLDEAKMQQNTDKK